MLRTFALLTLLLSCLAFSSNQSLCSLSLFRASNEPIAGFARKIEPLSLYVYRVWSQDMSRSYVVRADKNPNSSLSFESFAGDLVTHLSDARAVPSRLLGAEALKELRKKFRREFKGVESASVQPYVESLSLKKIFSTHVTPKGKAELADLLFARLLAGIPDNHPGNFVFFKDKIYSIDHAYLGTLMKGEDPLDFLVLSTPNPSGEGAATAIERVQEFAAEVSDEFKEKIENLKLDEFHSQQGGSFVLSAAYREGFQNRLQAIKKLLKNSNQ